MDPKPKRLLSLDAFRGLTIAGMILVNNPGSWREIYPPLRHADWHGCTPTDLVFPFFLFIVGVSMAFSFSRRIEQGADRLALVGHVLRRSIILILLGLCMYGFPDFRLIGPYIIAIIGLQWLASHPSAASLYSAAVRPRPRLAGVVVLLIAVAYFALDFNYFEASALRVPGVLQRIGVCYLLASLVVLGVGTRGVVIAVVGLLVGYALLVGLVPAPADHVAAVKGPEGLLHNWVDEQLLGVHLYRERPDPEGLLSTLTATATTLLGVLTGRWLRQARDSNATTVGLFVAANLCVLLGWCLDGVIPLNKKIWTTSYVIFTAGLALQVLGMLYWFMDVRGWRRWAWPFVVFGSNAIVVFVASSLVAKMSYRWKSGGGVSLHAWVYERGFASWASPRSASLLFALAFILFWLMLLVPLYRRKILVKI